MKKLLIVTRDQQDFYNEIMKHDYKDLIVYAPESEQEIIELVPQADIILANPPLCKKYINQTKEDVRVQSTFA